MLRGKTFMYRQAEEVAEEEATEFFSMMQRREELQRAKEDAKLRGQSSSSTSLRSMRSSEHLKGTLDRSAAAQSTPACLPSFQS